MYTNQTDNDWILNTVKHGCSKIMVRCYFSGEGIGPICKIDGIIDRFISRNISKFLMLPYAEEERPLNLNVYSRKIMTKNMCQKLWLQNKLIEVRPWTAAILTQSRTYGRLLTLKPTEKIKTSKKFIWTRKNSLLEAISLEIIYD